MYDYAIKVGGCLNQGCLTYSMYIYEMEYSEFFFNLPCATNFTSPKLLNKFNIKKLLSPWDKQKNVLLIYF